jgi:ubiquinone/menaquinone biosynthesis C-methylase UbiE
MNRNSNIYVCPDARKSLSLQAVDADGDDVVAGQLVCPDGHAYAIRDGIPDFLSPEDLTRDQAEIVKYYDDVAAVYDDVAYLTFQIQYVDETEERKRFVSLLDLSPDQRVLELACGTGRDSELIVADLDDRGRFFGQDISQGMLRRCAAKLARASVPIELSRGDACRLPFPDGYFDAVFSFGGLGVFGDIAASLREIVRVSKVGAQVVVGDESMPPWLRGTEYANILLNNNPLFEKPVPLEHLPVEARDVVVRWMIGGVYYVIAFTVGAGEPRADFDLEIPGRRGGTLRTRYDGRLEGVTRETKKAAARASEHAGKSVHQWLDEVVRAAAEKELSD